LTLLTLERFFLFCNSRPMVFVLPRMECEDCANGDEFSEIQKIISITCQGSAKSWRSARRTFPEPCPAGHAIGTCTLDITVAFQDTINTARQDGFKRCLPDSIAAPGIAYLQRGCGKERDQSRQPRCCIPEHARDRGAATGMHGSQSRSRSQSTKMSSSQHHLIL
jgi:hypothetical protein